MGTPRGAPGSKKKMSAKNNTPAPAGNAGTVVLRDPDGQGERTWEAHLDGERLRDTDGTWAFHTRAEARRVLAYRRTQREAWP